MTIRGWIDEISEHRVRGWAHYPENPSRSEKISVAINGTDVLQVLACKERQDLSSQHIPFTKKGFEFHLSDFIDQPVNKVTFTHVETREILGEDHYLIFSTNPSLWTQAQGQDLTAVRDAFARRRRYFQTPLAGSWNQAIDFEPVANALIPLLDKNKQVCILQFEPPSPTFARSIAKEKTISRVGIIERAAQLHDWHVDNSDISLRPELYDDVSEANQLWDVVFLPLMHEQSGPTFSDILRKVGMLLARSGILVFDIKIDLQSKHPYLLSDGSRLLRISTIEDAMGELSQAGLKVLQTLNFFYVGQDSQSLRRMIFATKSASGDRT